MVKLLRTEDIAELTGETPQRWRARRVSGDTPPYQKIGRRCFYLESDILDWLAARRVGNTAEGKALRLARIEAATR
jgi:predicted DNA-binding transcriptional regulator AlpA